MGLIDSRGGARYHHAAEKEMKPMDLPIVENVSREEVKQGLADGSLVLIDVREPHEWAAGHIPGAILHPLSSFDPAKLPKAEAGKRIVFQCNSGRRTLAALQAAQAAGRSDLTAHYEGSFQDWRNAGEKVVTE